MISRRGFIKTGAVAGTVLVTPAVLQAQAGPLPSSIAALKSRKEEAKPISSEERHARQERARQLMVDGKLDGILLMEGTSLNYFTGIRWWGGERLFAVVLPAKGAAFYVCPAFEEGRAREQLGNAPDGGAADVRIWQENDSPYGRVAEGLRDRGIASGKLGIEETVRFVFSDGIARETPTLKIASATPVTAGCRRTKSAHEIELMRLASQVTVAAYEAVHGAIKEGMTKPQIEELVSSAHEKLGFSGDADVQIGEYTAFPHGSVTPQIVRENSIVMMDGGCRAEGYQSDITRTFVLGKPSDKMKSVFEIVHRAQAAALQTARPGIECQAVDAAARKVVTDAGYGPDYKFFTHRLGHGMGMDGHEWPYLVRGNTTLLAADMTFSDEPGIYIRGEFGIRLEDDMHITENGAELFTAQSPSLEDPFGK